MKIVLFVYSLVLFQMGGDSVMQLLTYNTLRIKNSVACSADQPSKVVNGCFYQSECALLCMSESGCKGVNWKNQSICELFFFDLKRLSVDETCSHRNW